MDRVGDTTRIDEGVFAVVARPKDAHFEAEGVGTIKQVGSYSDCADYAERNSSVDNYERYHVAKLDDEEAAAEQAKVAARWGDIPERYIPRVGKPWRVSWGIGVFEDFATEREAREFYEAKRESEKGDWQNLVNQPFNAVGLNR